jgi:hypothetical protein
MASTFEALLLAQMNYLLNNTLILLAATTLSTPSANAVLNVPSGTNYNNLKVFWRARSVTAVVAEQMFLQFNGDTGNNYLWEVDQANNATIAGSTSGAATSKIQIATVPAGNATANYFGSGEFTVGGANDATNFKTAAGVGTAYGATNNMWTGTYGGQWNSAAAVTSLTITANGGNLAAGCRFSLYGMN